MAEQVQVLVFPLEFREFRNKVTNPRERDAEQEGSRIIEQFNNNTH